MTDDVRPEAACGGAERHRHYQFGLGRHVWHSHAHTPQAGDANDLHHHGPVEHDGLSVEELTGDVPVAEEWMWR